MTYPPSPRFTADELRSLGFAEVGENVAIDRTCRFYGIEHIRIGSNVRIDAFCVLSAGAAGVRVGNYIHLSTGMALLGGGGVVLEDYATVSARVCIFSSNDDYWGEGLAGPMVPLEYRRVHTAPVVLRRHALVGAGSVVLPGVTIGTGGAVGALSLVSRPVDDFTVVAGIPARVIGPRSRKLLELEASHLMQGVGNHLRADRPARRGSAGPQV
jgi:galactoside O-acetyltransferase